jgi:Fur family ferric uptake transcriptional regulator
MEERQVEQGELRARLAAGGVRVTRQRLRVLEELAREPHDLTAQALYQRVREQGERVGLATVYRTLGTLAEHGVVDTLAHHAGEACYRLCSDAHHHHLVCTNCHSVSEIAECGLDGWLERVAATEGFEPVDHRVEIVGLCADCRD